MADPIGLLSRGARYLDFCKFYGRMGSPRRVVSGILTVIVRNAEGEDTNDWDSGLDDLISMTEDQKGTSAVDAYILQPPFWNPNINAAAADINYPDLDIATEQNGYPIVRGDIPWEHGWDRMSGIGRKKAVGDYDCFLYHLTLAVNLQAPVLMYSTEDSGIDTIVDGSSALRSATACVEQVYNNVPIKVPAGGVAAYADVQLLNENNPGAGIFIYDTKYTVRYGGHNYLTGVLSDGIDEADSQAIFGATTGLFVTHNNIDININALGDCLYEGPHTTAWINAQNLAGSLPYDDYDAVTNPTGNELITPFPNNTDAVWYDVVDHKHCQSFVKWSLISRHNNAYDHHDWSPYPRHLNMESAGPGDIHYDRSEILWRHLNTGDETVPEASTVDDYEPNDGTIAVPGADEGTEGGLFGDYYHYGTVVNGKNARGEIPYPQGMVERDEYCMYVDEMQTVFGEYIDGPPQDIGYPLASAHNDFRQGLTHRRKYIFNTGTSSYHPDSLGNDMSIYGNPEADHDPNINMLRKARQGYNRFFTPVHRIDIYATHPLDKTSQSLVYDSRANPNETIRETVNLYKLTAGGNVHDIDFYSLVVNIQAFSFSEDTNFPEEVDEESEKVHFYNRTQVLFQAFGETSNIRLTMTEPAA
jgi:hypothetical protein